MAKKVENPEFPHLCVIYKVEGETSFSDGEKETVYAGKCMKYGNSSLRSFKSNGVYKGDYGLDIPVTGLELCGWGTTLYFNLSKN